MDQRPHESSTIQSGGVLEVDPDCGSHHTGPDAPGG